MDCAKLGAAGGILLLALLGVYSNHFHNSFHFDDAHAVQENPYIRDLHNIPKFFVDATTFSSLPGHHPYRPVTSTTLALDYRLAHGYDTLWYHIDSFVTFLLLLAAMFAMYIAIVKNGWIALFATALFALHPVSAESVNYIIQRSEIQSALGMVVGLVMYIYWPAGRRWFLYLVPVMIGSLAKPPALAFLPMLFVYLVLFGDPPGQWMASVRACVPAGIASAVMVVFQQLMTPKSYETAGGSTWVYWMTQPIVTLHYFKSFFLPTELTADTDRPRVESIFSEPSVIGLAFLVLLAWMIVRAMRSGEPNDQRPAAFGLLWFVATLAPTALIPLAEVENDHRMFLPFVGLSLAVCWYVATWLKGHPNMQRAAPGIAVIILAGCGLGTWQRNKVWRTEESLWQDTALKSPRNGRALMNYGLTLMNRGDYSGAIDYFQRGESLLPNYATLRINLGIAFGATGDDNRAENYFRQALSLAPEDAQGYYFYARWLNQKGRQMEAIPLLQTSISKNGSWLLPRYLLMQVYASKGASEDAKALAQQTLAQFPGDTTAQLYLTSASKPALPTPVASIPLPPPSTNQAEALLNLSLQFELAGRHEECIAAAKKALEIRPGYAEAYNNIAAGYQSLGRWDEAIQAAQEAVRLKPDFQLAKNNLQFSINQKRLQQQKK